MTNCKLNHCPRQQLQKYKTAGTAKHWDIYLVATLLVKLNETSLQEAQYRQPLQLPTTPLMHATVDIRSENMPATFH